MSHPIRVFTVFSIGCLCICSAHAQKGTGKEGEVILQKLDKNFKTLDALILGRNVKSSKSNYNAGNSTFVYYNKGNNATGVDSVLSNRTIAQIGELKGETGLLVTGQTYYRPDSDLGIEDDEGVVSRYKAKAQVELEWDFLHSALYRQRERIQELVIKEEIDRKQMQKAGKGLYVSRLQQSFRDLYDSLLAGVLTHHCYNLQLLSDAQQYLLRHEDVSSDALLQILNDKADKDRMLAAISPDKYHKSDDLSDPSGVAVMIDTLSLFHTIETTQYDLATIDLRMQLIDNETATTSYWNAAHISPFVRGSYYVRAHEKNSTNVDVGVTFRFPLSAEAARHKKTLKAQKSMLEAERAQMKQQLLETARLTVIDVERLNRLSMGELERLRKLKKYIAMRVNAYNHRVGGYNLLARAKEYNNYLGCWEKLLEYQYRRDCLIASLQNYLSGNSILQYCREVKL
jgi:hypothetical protein